MAVLNLTVLIATYRPLCDRIAPPAELRRDPSDGAATLAHLPAAEAAMRQLEAIKPRLALLRSRTTKSLFSLAIANKVGSDPNRSALRELKAGGV